MFTITLEDGKQLLIAANKKQGNFSSTTTSLTGPTKLLDILAKNIEVLSLANNCLLSDKKVLLSANSHFRFKLSYQCESSVDHVTINFESLIHFNFGVELGQLCIVVFVCYFAKLTIKLLPKSSQATVLFSQVFSSLLCGLGVFWFVSRTLVFI